MKKLFILVIIIVLSLAGCNRVSEQPESESEQPTEIPSQAPTEEPPEPIELSVLIPFGSPALAMSGLIINEDMQQNEYSLGENNSYNIEIVNGADPLIAAFTSQSHDIIIAPTNLGAMFYNSGIPYIYTGAVVYGNLYLASLQTLDTPADLEGMEIVAFSQNATPDVVLLTIINENGLSDKVTIRYVNSVNEAQAELLSGTADAALLAEPILSVTKTKAEINIIDLQAEWTNVTGAQSYPQAGVYAKSTLVENHGDLVSLFMEIVQTSVRETNENPAAAAAALEDIEFGLPAKIIESSIPNSHLLFKTALESKADLEFYYNKIMELNPKLVGNKLPDDNFYN